MTDPLICERFGENMKRARARAGISQEELGFRASLHRTEVGQLERGVRMPRIDTVLKLAGSLGVSPCELLEGMSWQAGRFEEGSFRSVEPAEGAGGEQLRSESE